MPEKQLFPSYLSSTIYKESMHTMKPKSTKRYYGLLLTAAVLLFAGRGAAQSGKALNFVKANNQYVTVPHNSSINLGANFTMEAIVNYTGSNSTIIDKGNYDFLWQLNANSNNNRMGFFIANTNTWVYSTGSVPQGVSTHVAIVGSGGSITFYINGGAAGGGSGAPRQDNLAMNIGRQQPSPGGCQCNHMNGTIDELRIWNVARSQSQISTGINLGVPSNSAGLVALYNFDEGSGSTTTDASGNGNNGTLVNGPSWVASYARPGSYTYTVPAGVDFIKVQLWGGGAAGGTCDGPSGGGGVFVQSKSLAVTPGQVYTVVPGTGGYLVNQGGGESYISLNGNKIIGALGGTPKFGQGTVFGAANAEYSYKGGDAGTNIQYVDGSGTHILYGGGGASGGTTGPGGNGVNANNTDGVGPGGQPGGTGGTGGSGGHQIDCEQLVSPFAGTGATPGGGGGAPFADYLRGGGGHGKIIITGCFSAGTIAGHTMPFPYELSVDSVYSTGTGGAISPAYIWEQSSNNSTWATAPGGITSRSYPLLGANPPDLIYYRRKETSCGFVSNTAIIKTFTQANGLLNGTIRGDVKSTGGTGVDGITVTAQKTVSLLGSPVTKTYTTVTANGGQFSIQNVFYGDVANSDPGITEFTVWATKANHTFSPPQTANLSNTDRVSPVITIVDSTVYSITGTVSQNCAVCEPGFTTGTLDSVKVTPGKSTFSFQPSYTGGANGRGNFGCTLTDPGQYIFTPNYKNHTFNPVAQTINITNGDVAGINFSDNTVRTISGVLRAGCNQVIGSAQLEFTDTVKGYAGPQLKKLVTTATDGSYSVTLPARKYKVRVLSFTPSGAGTDISSGDLITFFNTTAKDSMMVDIDTLPRIFDIVYHRAPVLQIQNLIDTTFAPYTLFRQGKAKTFIVNLFEGNPSHGCKIATDSTKRLKLSTSVQVEDIDQVIQLGQVNGADTITLVGGSPNIIAPFYKTFRVQYMDRYGRAAADIFRNAVVLGLKNDPGTFTTVSPQIPLMILHQPPGDQSVATWESSSSVETALRFYAAKTDAEGGFVEVKLGTKFLTGFLAYFSEVSVWGTINVGQNVTAKVNESTEAIVTTSTTTSYSTPQGSGLTGSAGDTYIGTAINLLYARAHELKYVSNQTLGVEDKLAIGQDGFSTNYVYTEDHILNIVIPTLREISTNPTVDTAQRARAANQMKVWQQVVANNDANKARAAFDKNLTFSGGPGIHNSTTTSSTKSSTIEFTMEIDRTLAIGLGFEIAGIGVSGGVNINMKMETGKAKTTTSTESTTIGYDLKDDDIGDYFTVDVKKDPVYNTPVFAMVAGTSSCPTERPAQARYVPQLNIPNPVRTNVPATDEVLYELHIANVSESVETRSYILNFDYTTANGAIVTVSNGPIPINGILVPDVGYGSGNDKVIVVSVRKSAASSVFSYEGLRFTVSDACSGGGSESTSKYVSVSFNSPCSGIILAAPANNWTLSSANNNVLPVQFSGYTLANLQSVTLEHTAAGGSSWATDNTIYQGLITDAITTTINWNVAGIPDGSYDLRLKLVCASGTVYSQRVTGIIDRNAPLVFGIPEPTNNSYTAGGMIGLTYNEAINTQISGSQVQLRRVSDNTLIPVQVSGYQNRIVVVPTSPITGMTGENMRLVVTNIADIYGNTRTVSDTSYFVVGTTVAGTGPTAVNLSSLKNNMMENLTDSMDIRFTVTQSATNDRRINFTVGGTATYGEDYIIRLSNGQPISSSVTGVQGNVTILANTTQAVVRIYPIKDNMLEPDETIIISLGEGGDYVLGSVISQTVTIRNDDLNPPVILRTGPLNICAGQSLTLSTNSVLDGKNIYSYNWNNGAGFTSGNQTISVTQPGTYILTVYTLDGFTGVSGPINVTVSALTAPSLGADITINNICYEETTNLLSLFNTTGLTSSWNTQNTTMAPRGIYRLVAANAGGCTDTAFVTVKLDVATWLGTTSSEWNTPANWSTNLVPTALTHVIVPGGTPNPCIVSTVNAVAASIQVRNGGIVRTINNMQTVVNGKCLTLPPN